jgi:putative glutamine transport system substrate-binding protein
MKTLSTTSKFLAAVLLVGAAQLSAQAQLKGDSYASAKSSKQASVTYTYVQTPGFTEKSGTQVSGFCVDLMSAFADWLKKEEGITLSVNYNHTDAQDFKKFMGSVKTSQGGVFGLGNITITEERKSQYNFSPPFITNVAIMVTHKDVPTLQNLDQIAKTFAGMQAVSVKATLNEQRLKNIQKQHMPKLTYKYVTSSVAALEAVSKDPNLFANLDFTYYLEALKQGMPIKRHPAGDESSEHFGIIMPKNSDWAPAMERFMSSGFTESTEYRQMVAKNLGGNALKLLDAVASR